MMLKILFNWGALMIISEAEINGCSLGSGVGFQKQ